MVATMSCEDLWTHVELPGLEASVSEPLSDYTELAGRSRDPRELHVELQSGRCR